MKRLCELTSKLSHTISSLTIFSIFITAHADEPEIGAGITELPLFDAHVHYSQPAWGPFPPATVLSIMDEAGVALALVSSTPDDGSIRLWEYAPNRFIPELRPYHDEIDSANWTEAPDMIQYLQQRMEQYPHRGIGEFHIHEINPANSALLGKIAQLAKQHHAIIHIHSYAEPVALLFELEPTLTIIWAHAGMTEDPATIGSMMERHTALYADTSYRESDILDGGIEIIASDWEELILRFPDRFLIGSDTWTNSRWQEYNAIIAENRRWLSHFPREIAEMIAYKNAERLFRRDINTKPAAGKSPL